MTLNHESILLGCDVPKEVDGASEIMGISTPSTLRRSGRARKPPNLMMAGAQYEMETKKSPTERLSDHGINATRRNPKRKAAPEIFDLPNDLLEASLAPIRPEEQSEWDSWVELESDPVREQRDLFPDH
jgi:hypothetical protein